MQSKWVYITWKAYKLKLVKRFGHTSFDVSPLLEMTSFLLHLMWQQMHYLRKQKNENRSQPLSNLVRVLMVNRSKNQQKGTILILMVQTAGGLATDRADPRSQKTK